MKSSITTSNIIKEREKKITVYQTLLVDNLVGEDYSLKRAKLLQEIITEDQIDLASFKRGLVEGNE